MEENTTQWRDQVEAWNKAYKRKKKIIILSIFGVILAVVLAVVSYFFIIPAIESRVATYQAKVDAYNQGLQLLEEGKLDEAAEAFWMAGDYKDAKDYSGRLNYDRAEKLLAEGKVTYAAIAFGKAGDYKDAHDRSFELWDRFADRMTNQKNEFGKSIAWIKDDGTPGFKYDNRYRVIGDRYDQWYDLVDISVEIGTIGTRRDGSIVYAVDTSQELKLDWHDVIAARWYSHIVGLQSDGTVRAYCCSYSNQGDCTMRTAVKGWTDVISFCMCGDVLIGLKADGTLLTATCASDGEDTIGRNRMLQDLAMLENVVAVRSQYNDNQAAILQADGTIRRIGEEKAKEFGDFDPQKGALIAAAFPDRSQQHYDQALAYLAQGQTAQAAMAFGRAGAYKDAHQRSMELWNQIVRRETIATKDKVIAALRPDGTVAVIDPGKTMGKKPLNSDKQYVALASVSGRIWGITLEGTVFPIGVEENPLSEYHDIVMIAKSTAAYRYPAYLLRSDGTVIGEKTDSLAWGNVTNIFVDGDYAAAFADGTARIGWRVYDFGSTDQQNLKIASWTDVVEVVMAGIYNSATIALKADGTVEIDEADPEVAYIFDPAQWTDIVDIASDGSAAYGVRKDGRVVVYGDSSLDLKTVREKWTNIVQITVSDKAVVGLKKDGTLVYVGEDKDLEKAAKKLTGLMVPES